VGVVVTAVADEGAAVAEITTAEDVVATVAAGCV
jgi:hypothetical protein